jgi:hypothetical protein
LINDKRRSTNLTRMDARIIEALRGATRVVILTGAGVSAESGIPTFRDKQTGLWENFDAAELSTPDAFERDPALVWGWYEWRHAAVLNAQPNPAHRAIAAMANHVSQLTLNLPTQRISLKFFNRLRSRGDWPAERLVNLLATFCILSWRIFWLTMINRSTRQA